MERLKRFRVAALLMGLALLAAGCVDLTHDPRAALQYELTPQFQQAQGASVE